MSDDEVMSDMSSDGSDGGGDDELAEDELDEDELDKGKSGGGRFSCPSFDVYTTAAVDDLIAGRVAEVMSLLALDHTTALALLLAYNFSEEKVTAAVLKDRTAALSSVGTQDTAGNDPAKKKSKPTDFVCSVCFETAPTDQGLSLACGHIFCRPCWSEHLRAKLDEGGRAVAMAPCPWRGCKAMVGQQVWEALLGPKEVGRYQAAVREQFGVHVFRDVKPCPKEQCSCVVHWHSKVNLPVTCICSFRFCYACHDEDTGDHSPCSCEEVQLWNKKFSSESENLLFIRAHTRMCPQCRSPIEKNGGCMHMTCRRCKHEFCWICNGDWRNHKACDPQKPEIQARENSERSAKTELERFEHYMHRWESHKKAAAVARKDLTNLFELESYYVKQFEVRTSDVDFVKPTLNALTSGRLMLAWSYVREFYSDTKRISQVERNMWSFGLSELEVYTDQLQECYEKGKDIDQGRVGDFTRWKEETIERTRVAQKYFDGFVNGVLKGTLVIQGGAGSSATEPLSEAERFYAVQLELLGSMGFSDRKRLIRMLEDCGGDSQRVLDKLIS